MFFVIFKRCLKWNKQFKWTTNNATSFNLMTYLFVKNVMIQFMRLNLIETWNYSHFDIVKTLNMIDSQCFNFVQSFLSFHERSIENDEAQTHHIYDDFAHYKCRLSLSKFVLNNRLRMKSTAKLMKLSSRHFFLQSFMIAYQRNYNISIINFDNKNLKWYQKVIYIDK